MRADPQPRDTAHGFSHVGGEAGIEDALAGMGPRLRAALAKALGTSDGLILVGGPVGSGRSSTLAALAAARPDAVVLIGTGGRAEAGRAIAAAKQNLVLARVDAGDAIACVHRFIASGAELFDLACALRLVLCQRLVRRLCGSCRARVQPANAVTAPLGLDPGSLVYEAAGCELCAGSGYAGQVAVFEAIPVDADVGRLIVRGGEGAAIANHVFRTWPNLAASARALVVQGGTTAAEAIRLIRDAQRQ